MAKLKDLARLIRSKNAGPFMLTFDVLFDNAETYQRVRDARILSPEVISQLYHVPVDRVQFYEYDAARALKATIPRPVASGDLGDCDVYGGQQHGPLLELEVPGDKSVKPNWQEAIAGYPRLVTSFDLRPRSTALVITDIQNRAISSQFGLGAIFRVRHPEVHEYFTKRLNEIVIPNNVRLLNFFRERGLRVIFLTVGPELPDGSDWVSPIKLGFSSYQRSTGIRGLYPRGTPEHRVIAPLAPRPDELVINKTTSGAFNSTGFEVTLRTLGIDTMLITGLSTCACVETTARAASDRGIKCAIIEDCCAAFDQELHNTTMRSVYLYYGDVRNTDEVIGELASRLGAAIPGGAE